MKRLLILLFLIFMTVNIFGDELQDLIIKANTAYARGSYHEAISILDMAAATYATDFDRKSVIADNYNIIGEKEYNRSNFLNAYECYRKAVKVYPTHKAASNNFWKMKKNFDVDNLKNEGGTRIATTDGTVTDTLDKAEDMLKELEKSEASATDSEEIRRYKEELARQNELIKEMQRAYGTGGTAVAYQDPASRQLLNDLVKLYEDALATKEVDPDILASQMKEYRIIFEQQQASQFNLVIIFIGSIAGLLIVIFLALYILYRIARKRQKERFAFATSYDMGLGYTSPLSLEEKHAHLLSYQDTAKDSETKEIENENSAEKDVYQDIVKAEHLKEMYNEKKYGTLKWDTVKEYISDLEKELRSDILYVVENKINSGDLEDYTQILPVIFPFLTDSDDYLRDKAQHLLTSAVESDNKRKRTHVLLEYDEGQKKGAGSFLSIPSLMKHIDKLKYTKTARGEHCINTAKYARGMAAVLNFPKENVDFIYKSALVHDIGYLLLDKDKLADIETKKDINEAEIAFIRSHPKKGLEYFKNLKIKLPKQMADGIISHHERNDGSGYPQGLRGDEIPEVAKIVGIADAFDALTASRVFRDKMSFHAASIIMRDLGRNKFEGEYVEALIEYLKSSGKIKR
jgi:putative nucleotidyltransferase with HDIG domain